MSVQTVVVNGSDATAYSLALLGGSPLDVRIANALQAAGAQVLSNVVTSGEGAGSFFTGTYPFQASITFETNGVVADDVQSLKTFVSACINTATGALPTAIAVTTGGAQAAPAAPATDWLSGLTGELAKALGLTVGTVELIIAGLGVAVVLLLIAGSQNLKSIKSLFK